MKKGLIVFGLIFSALWTVSCDEDDVCVGEGTPYLTVVFRNNLNTENFKDSLTIWSATSPDFSNEVQVLPKTFTDSIKLPLGGVDNSVTYFRIKRGSNAQDDILEVNYTTHSQYVSKACGFRLVYQNLSYETTNFYIENIIPNSSNVLENEEATNLYIALSF